MADQGRWFKLWVSCLNDPSLSNLSLEDFGRWCRFGAILKVHGNEGSMTVVPPARALQETFRVESYDAVLGVLHRFPNCDIIMSRSVTNATVTWRNWPKYQSDNSAERTRKWRERVTPKKRREETKKRRDKKDPPIAPQDFEQFWKAYPKKRAKDDALKAWGQIADTRPPIAEMLAAVESQSGSPDWTKQGGQFIPLPATWLRGRRWQDQVEPRFSDLEAEMEGL